MSEKMNEDLADEVKKVAALVWEIDPVEPLRAVSLKTVNNVTSVEGKNAGSPIGIARAAFAAGAEEMAARFSREVKTGDMKRVLGLLTATETDSFYATNYAAPPEEVSRKGYR